MKNLPQPLSPQERTMLQSQLGQHISGNVSEEQIHRVIRDRNGREYDLGGRMHEVQIDSMGVPRVVLWEEGRLLDCGHVVESVNQVSVCNQGHVVCARHPLTYCGRCGRPLCLLCSYEIVDAQAICTDHSLWLLFKSFFK